MATAAFSPGSVTHAKDQSFFQRFAVALSVVTVLCFAQLAVRGLTDPLTAPVWVHVHALLMLGWLGLFIAQSRLAASHAGLHRKLGVGGALLAGAMLAMGWFIAFKTLQAHRLAPDFDPAFFLATTIAQITVFAGLVAVAILLRHRPDWHPRLMVAATIMICGGPASSRLLPDALSAQPRAAWIYLAVDAALLALVARHDHKVCGTIHPATQWSAAVIGVAYALVYAASYADALAIFPIARLQLVIG